MKKILLTFVLLVGIVAGLFAQKLTYQAVIRDNNQQLVVNTAVKATVTITFTTGTPTTYSEEVNATTNLHGLLSIEFGDETLLGRDWTDATIAVRVVNANNESTVYVGGDARPVSAVPYALSVDGVAIQNYLTEHNYVDKAELDSRHYLTSDSTVITTMQGNITANATNITSLQGNLSAAISKEKTDSTTLAGRIDALENASMDCNDVKGCIKDTLGAYSTTDVLNGLLQQLEDKIAALSHKVDSLAALIPGGDEPTPCTPTSSTHNIEISISELPYTFGDTTFQTGTTAGTYTLHRTNVGGCDSTITINLSFFTCGTDKVKDVDNNKYNTVAIGNQCWMKENMKTTKYANNTAVNNKKMFNPGNSQDNVAIFGKLYNWSAATRDSSTTYPAEGQVKVQGICPTGWHVPSKAEFDTLTNYVNGKTEYKCGTGIANALSSPTGWNNSGTSGCNAGDNSTTRNKTDFSAVPTGYYYVGIGTSGYAEFGDCAYFWSATQRSDDNKEACSLYLTKISVLANESNREKTRGFSVRCLKD